MFQSNNSSNRPHDNKFLQSQLCLRALELQMLKDPSCDNLKAEKYINFLTMVRQFTKIKVKTLKPKYTQTY